VQEGPLGALIWIVAILVVAFLFARQRRRRGRVGSGAAGGVYDWLNEERRKAIEVVVEQRAEARDPENRDGNLPELEEPTAPRT
jgi:MYXO-CTERM domain-containing protein